MKQYIAILILLLSACSASYAQVDRRDVRKGNRDFRKENFKEADISYRKALVKDSMSVAANYNLASTLYRMGDMQQAASTMERIREVAPASEHGADYHYNMGDIALASENYQAAVDAFRQALLLNPGDMDAKENYIYAKKKLQDQQNQQNQNQDNQNQDNQNKDNQDNQNKDNQNKDNQNQDNKDNQDKDNQDQDNQDQDNQDQDKNNDQNREQPQQGQDNKPQITPQAAQQMLQAIQAKEKETQDKVNREKAKALKSKQKEKNW